LSVAKLASDLSTTELSNIENNPVWYTNPSDRMSVVYILELMREYKILMQKVNSS
jgi:hypothetical protein